MTMTGAAVAPQSSVKDRSAGTGGVIVAYVCENAGRPGAMPSSGLRRRPTLPDFGWPLPVHEIAVPCAGRLQPEHFLKALEDGADAIGVICCEEGNCHHHEGNRRCRSRLEYVSGLAAQVGLGDDRMMLFHLPGSAAQDMALGVGATPLVDSALAGKIASVRDDFVAWLTKLSRNPLAHGELPDESPYEVETEDESDE